MTRSLPPAFIETEDGSVRQNRQRRAAGADNGTSQTPTGIDNTVVGLSNT